MKKPKKVAILTAGGLAPCLSSAIGSLIERYTEIDPTIEIICYRGGYKGLLLGDSYKVTPEVREKIGISDGLLRVSVGIEEVENLLTVLEEALRKA